MATRLSPRLLPSADDFRRRWFEEAQHRFRAAMSFQRRKHVKIMPILMLRARGRTDVIYHDFKVTMYQFAVDVTPRSLTTKSCDERRGRQMPRRDRAAEIYILSFSTAILLALPMTP